ncbi:MAG: adenylate/guanylate cyclase domain-containing protein [Rhodospirillaceae bacterium]|nr:adenylate/guanylate cyclase domain-containing protein [Rhodospirillaceae bacterium]
MLETKTNKKKSASRRLKDAELLLKVSKLCASLDSLDEVLENLVLITSQEIKCERATLFLNDPVTNELYSRFAQGDLTREIRILNNVGIAGHVFSTGEGLIVPDAYNDPRFNKDVDQQTGFKTSNILCAPVRTAKGNIIGAMQALNKQDGTFENDDLYMLEQITMQAAVALESNIFTERMTKKREQEMKFLDLVADVTAELDLGTLLQRVMSEATRMLSAERSTLFLNDEKTNELFSRIAQGDSVGEIRLPNHLGIAGTVFTSGKSVNIPHAYADLRFNPSFDKQTGFFTRSILCVPITNKDGKVIGVTQALNKKGGPFTEEDESRLKAFTAQVAIALENAKLFDDVQQMKEYNDAVLESMTNGVVTIDDQGKIVTCNKAGLQIFRVNSNEIIEKNAEEFFSNENSIVIERLKVVREEQQTDILMDAALTFNDEQISANLTVMPLLSSDTDGEKLGLMLMVEDISSEKRMKSTMSRYMDPGIADQLLNDSGDDIMGGANTTATVLFSDVRGFTTLTEELGAQGTVSFLNEYFTVMVDCISKEEGMLDKFIGDAIMAAFGLPISHDDDEDRAVRASISMISELWKWNKVRESKGLKPADMGIGLNTDLVVSGNIGSPKRMDYTLIGDGVNLAARLESACKAYSARILISENTFKKLKGTYRVRDVDLVVVKGKTEPVGVYEVLDYHDDTTFPNLMDVVSHFNEGIKLYRQANWSKAINQFEEAIKFNPDDNLSKTYIERCNHLSSNPPEGEWNGVWVMTTK